MSPNSQGNGQGVVELLDLVEALLLGTFGEERVENPGDRATHADAHEEVRYS
jgi:hypothetical protein